MGGVNDHVGWRPPHPAFELPYLLALGLTCPQRGAHLSTILKPGVAVGCHVPIHPMTDQVLVVQGPGESACACGAVISDAAAIAAIEAIFIIGLPRVSRATVFPVHDVAAVWEVGAGHRVPVGARRGGVQTSPGDGDNGAGANRMPAANTAGYHHFLVHAWTPFLRHTRSVSDV